MSPIQLPPIIRRRRWLFISLAVVALAGLGAWLTLDFILPRMLVVPSRIKADHRETPGRGGLRFDNFNVVSADGFTLKGWFVHATGDRAAGTVVLLHGHSSCKEHMLKLTSWLATHGYNVIAYDSRAQGESQGIYGTFGFKEKGDVIGCLDEAQKRYGNLGPVGIIGTSFGSAVAIQAMAADKRFRCGVVCSPFANLEETGRRELKTMAHFDSPWLLAHVLDRSGKIAGFRVKDIDNERTARQVPCPVLVIHGEKDARFPVAWGRRVYDAFPSPQKRWYLAKGATHDDVFRSQDTPNVEENILRFLDQNMRRWW